MDQINKERQWLVLASLLACGGVFLFFVLAPVFGYPLTYKQSFGVMQIILPVFLGYLGLATQYLFGKTQEAISHSGNLEPLYKYITRGPVILFAVICLGIVVAFGIANKPSAKIGEGMSVDTLALFITAALGLLSVTTGAVVANLFGTPAQAQSGRGQSGPDTTPDP